jgi:hypothetical protein
LLFLLHDGSACFLARRDQTDVGISGALHTGVGFFGPPTAAALDPPCGKVCPARTGRASSVSMFHNNPRDDLGPLSTPAELRSRWTIAESPTSLHAFWLKPVSLFGLFTMTMLTSV